MRRTLGLEVVLKCFFFQAEDGIRDLVRSRGLGDVYKRQIDLGFAHAEWGGTVFSFVDVPGHEKFVRTMVAGAAGIDVALLVVASDDGTRFRLPIDDVLQSKVRQSIPDTGEGRKLAPKEIQAHIRSGMSAQDVASITGAPLDYIQRFEGPVIAEREFVVTSALAVAVHTAADTDPLRQGKTFGTAIRERLHDLGGTNERWASWKDAARGWGGKLSFTANQIDHDARWPVDPKKHPLSPLNNEAITLSPQGAAAGTLGPRTRSAPPSEAACSNWRRNSVRGATLTSEWLFSSSRSHSTSAVRSSQLATRRVVRSGTRWKSP